MNCSKCGKEIPEGENKLCDECKESLLVDLENEEVKEIEAEVVEEKNEEKQEEKVQEEVAKEEETKEKTKDKKKSKKLIIIIAAIVALIVIIIAICIFIPRKNKIGISIGNNNYNFGYANAQGDWIYYMSLNEDSTLISINKIKRDKTEQTKLIEKDWEVHSINVVGEYIYFVAFEPIDEEKLGENEYLNNKIYKMTTDGEELTVINDNEFNEEVTSIYVVKDKIYYVGMDNNIYQMDTNGQNRAKISDDQSGYVGLSDKYILFNDYPENPESETDFVTYIMDLDGKNKKIVTDKRLYNANIVGDYIYYVNEENSEIRKIKVDGTEDKKIYSTSAYNMTVSGDYIYYLDFKENGLENNDEVVCIQRVKVDGSDHKIIEEMENYTSFINVVGDWIYYRDHNDNYLYMNLIKTDGSDKINIYTYGYGV